MDARYQKKSSSYRVTAEKSSSYRGLTAASITVIPRLDRGIQAFFLALFFLWLQICCAAPPQSNFELLESAPLNTLYSQSDITHPQPVWLYMINHAKKTIDIGAFYYISKPHNAMSPITEAIKNAAYRGVQIRLLLDETFKPNSQTAINELGSIKNIQILFMPMKSLAGGVMHAKYMIVDDENVFVGSQNFDASALNQNHEIGLYIRDHRLAQTILQVFNADWQKSGGAENDEPPFIPVTQNNPLFLQSHQLYLYPAFSPENLTPSGLDIEIKQLIQLLDQAKHEILIQVMQYSTSAGYKKKGYWDELDDAIRRAAERGVHVNIIVANWALKKPEIYAIKKLSSIPNIQIKYSTIPEYQGRFISYARVEHCKYMVIDNQTTWIGTGNWEKDYFYNSRDIAIIIQGIDAAEKLRKIFYQDWQSPYVQPIHQNENYIPPKTHHNLTHKREKIVDARHI